MKKSIIILMTMVMAFMVINTIYAGGKPQGSIPSSMIYQRDPNLNPPGVFPINKQTVTLKIGVEQNNQIPDRETNWQTQLMERQGNYKFIWEIYPSGELQQKFELMVMAGGSDMPDVFMYRGLNLAALTKYGQAGMVIPLNVYYENSAYYINREKQGLSLDPTKYVTSYDGNIYGVYYASDAVNARHSTARIMMYEPWLEKLRLSRPATIDQFTNVLRAFRDNDPNGNGQKDEIPFISYNTNMTTGVLYALMMPFIYTQPEFWMHNNGKIDVAFNKPGWRDGLRYIKLLVDEGLLSPLSFTQDLAQMTGVINPLPTRVGSFARISASNLGSNDPRRSEYVPITPLEGPAGRQSLYWPYMPRMSYAITKNCRTPESAFMLADWMCDEEILIMSRYGEKGVDWYAPQPPENISIIAGQTIPLKEINMIWGTPHNKHWASSGPGIEGMKYAFIDLAGADPNNPLDYSVSIARNILTEMQYAAKDPIVGLIYNEQEQAVINEFHSTILTYVGESYARFVMGDLSIDRDWNNYVSEFNRMGLTQVIAAAQSAWDRMNK